MMELLEVKNLSKHYKNFDLKDIRETLINSSISR